MQAVKKKRRKNNYALFLILWRVLVDFLRRFRYQHPKVFGGSKHGVQYWKISHSVDSCLGHDWFHGGGGARHPRVAGDK